ncbi:unnamed protein product [Clonostachys solani]|uniref:F-box domain-containing protein n=1 Tax=Clonostachys solani TaxID=160281 RepID=A0A9N9W2H0_9HYPO|nr:unnamed protein product [Clonostachys solani]
MSDIVGATSLPPEMWMVVVDHLKHPWDVAALAQTCRRLHAVVNPLLYEHAAEHGFDLRALVWAIRFRLLGTLSHALAAGADPNKVWRYFEPGAARRSAPTFDECIGSVPDTTQSDFNLVYPRPYCSPLHIAASLGDVEAMGMLLDHGAEPYAGSSRVCRCYDIQQYADPSHTSNFINQSPRNPRWTPAHVAICTGNIRAFELLSSRGGGVEMQSIDPNPATAYSGVTPIHVAAMSGQAEMLEWLLESDHEYDVDALDASGKTALLYAYYAHHWDCVTLLVRNGADINRDNRIILMLERQGYDPIYIVDDDIDVLSQGTLLEDSMTPSRFDDALRLLDLGADPVITDRTLRIGKSLIHKLCLSAWYTLPWDITKVESKPVQTAGMKLLNRFLDLGLNFQQTVTYPPLMYDEGHELGYTALGYAARAGNLLAVQRLIQAGANVDGNPEEDVNTPLACACKYTNGKPVMELVTLLVKAGASVNRLRPLSEAPLWVLHRAFDDDEPIPDRLLDKVTDYLLKQGSNPGRGTSNGDDVYYTALDYELLSGNLAEFEYLLSKSAEGSLGDDDILGFWKAVKSRPSGDDIAYVIKMDRKGLIAKKDPTALPFVICQNEIDPELVEHLLKLGVDPNVSWSGNTPLGCILQADRTEESIVLRIVKSLLEFGASIFQTLEPFHFTDLDEGAPQTPLGLAIHMRYTSFEVLEVLLEHQPLKDAPDIDPFEYILQACMAGSTEALTALFVSLGASSP